MPPEDSAESSEAPALPQSRGALARRGSCAHRDNLIPLWDCAKRMEKQGGEKGAEQNQQKSKRVTNVFPGKYFRSERAEIRNSNKNFGNYG